MKNKMTEPIKEQVEKWRNEFGTIFWDNSLPKYTVELAWQGYLAAKKSDFEEIKTLKEQLAKAESVIKFYSEGYVVDQAEWDDDDDAEWINTWSLYTGKRARKYFAEKEKLNKENKDEK